jgi:hypothetical protein
MHTRQPISKEAYWQYYVANKERLGVFSTITHPSGSWYNPFGGEMMTEWGFPDEDNPRIGIHEKWDVDEFDSTKRSNIRIDYWMCVPVEKEDS